MLLGPQRLNGSSWDAKIQPRNRNQNSRLSLNYSSLVHTNCTLSALWRSYRPIYSISKIWNYLHFLEQLNGTVRLFQQSRHKTYRNAILATANYRKKKKRQLLVRKTHLTLINSASLRTAGSIDATINLLSNSSKPHPDSSKLIKPRGSNEVLSLTRTVCLDVSRITRPSLFEIKPDWPVSSCQLNNWSGTRVFNLWIATIWGTARYSLQSPYNFLLKTFRFFYFNVRYSIAWT